MKKLFLIMMLLLTSLAYAQIPHKTRSTLQIDVASPVVHADSLLIYKSDKIVGFISYTDFVTQLEATGISGGGGGGATDLSIVAYPTQVEIVSSTGNNAFMPLATNVNSGLLSPAGKVKLDALVNFDPSSYARKDIAETFASTVTVISGLRVGNQTTYGGVYWYGGASGAMRVSAIFDQATKDLIFTNNETGGNYTFDGTVAVVDPVNMDEAVNVNYFTSHLAGTTNTTAFTPVSDYHVATKKYVDDAIAAGGGYTDELAQDAIGTILTDTNTINFTYNDGVPSITADVIEANLSITESQISDFGAYVSLAGVNVFTGASNTFNELVINDVTNAEITAGASNVLITKDWYNNNLYHTAADISFAPTGNTISTDVQAAIVEIQTELDGVSVPNLNDQFAIAGDYTTILANKDMKGVITAGNITLLDTGLSPEYQISFLNNKGIDVGWTLGTDQVTQQYGTGLIPPIPNNRYAYAELVADNTWSVVVGEDATANPGITDHTLLTSIGTNTHAQIDTHLADATTHFTQAAISITESQISDLAHTVNTNLSQAQVGTFATAEGFIKSYTETDPVWLAAEANVPRLNTVNIFTNTNTFSGFNVGTGTNLVEITSNSLSGNIGINGGAIDRDLNIYQGSTGNLVLGAQQDITVGLGLTSITNNVTIANDLEVNGAPDIGTEVGNRDYNDTRYEEDLGNPGTDGYVLSSTIAGARSWVANAGAGGGGNVSSTGTPLDNQLSIFTNATTIEGVAGLTFDGTEFKASNQYFGDFGELRFGGRSKIYSSSGTTKWDLLVGNLVFHDSGVTIGQLDKATGVFRSMATDAEILAVGNTALITKDYADSYYGTLAAVTANTAKITNATHTGDVSGSTTLSIGSNKVLESHLKVVNTPTDEYALTYEATTGDFEWQAAPFKTGTPTTGDIAVWSSSSNIQGIGYLSLVGTSMEYNKTIANIDAATAESLVTKEWVLNEKKEVDVQNSASTNYTCTSANYGKVTYMTAGSAVTINVNLAPAAGTVMTFSQVGAGQLVFVSGGSTTFNGQLSVNFLTAQLTNQYPTIQLIYRGSNDWHLIGDIE